MEIMIKGQPQDLRVSTVSVEPEDNNNVYSFHCSSCGKWIDQHAGRVKKIYPYYEPSNQLLRITTCSQCGRKYTFQETSEVSDRIRVILHPTAEVNFFYCADHKYKILQYNPVEMVTMSDMKRHHAPFAATCSQVGCKRVYFFAELI